LIVCLCDQIADILGANESLLVLGGHFDVQVLSSDPILSDLALYEHVYSPKKAAEKNTNTKAQTYLDDKNIYIEGIHTTELQTTAKPEDHLFKK